MSIENLGEYAHPPKGPTMKPKAPKGPLPKPPTAPKRPPVKPTKPGGSYSQLIGLAKPKGGM